ncbi:MAG: ribonuclease P protein component [Rothia sp. (in: high G+C Gram-positive bacteria)]|nr:ribonuclease P protein component [Rothia sp. (in: high G+C Gram-positive bacteria)]
MLAQQHRMRTKVQFISTTRSGARSGRRNLVLYADKSGSKPSQVGFIVSKAVGKAVVRNKVKRRLRELAAQVIGQHPHGLYLVIRALPASAEASWQELSTDFNAAYVVVLAKISKQDPNIAVAQSPETAACTHGEEF